MDRNTTNDNVIPIEHSLIKQQTQLDAKPTGKVIQQAKKKPMNPTPLEYSCWSRHRTATAMGVFGLFISLSLTIGTIIVCLTASKATIPKCQLNFKPTSKNPLDYNYNPRSVAANDFNNDTRTDIVVCNRIADSISVFLASSNGNFERPQNYPTDVGSAPSMVAVGDFNTDQQPDLAVAYFGFNSIGIFLGLDNGSFINHTVISTNSSRPIWIHLADLDNDTLLDMVIVNYGTHSISILGGDGNGKFYHRTIYSTGYDSFPTSVISGDFNDDDFLDLAIVNSGTNNVVIFFGSKNADFSESNILSTGIDSRPNSIAIGYFNHDRLLDIVVANSGTNNIGIFLNTGNGTFTYQTTSVLEDASPYSISVADINKDNQMDLIVTNIGVNNVIVLSGDGNGNFDQPILYSTGSLSSISVAVGDFNSDTLLDIVVVSNDTNSISFFFANARNFQSEAIYSISSDRSSSSTSSLSSVSPMDYIICPGAIQNIYIGRDGARSVAVGDFNNDAHLDIVVANNNPQNIGVFLGYGNGSFAEIKTYSADPYPIFVAVGNFNNDSFLDVVILHSFLSPYNISIRLGHGNGSFGDPIMYSTGSDISAIAISDVNNDTLLDIIATSEDNNKVNVLLGYGNGHFALPIIHSAGSYPSSVEVDDFNNDKKIDIVIINYRDNNVGILLGYSNGSFADQITHSTGSNPSSLAVGDFNNDKKLDIVVTDYNSYAIIILFGCGNGSFGDQMIYSTGFSPTYVTVGDFNSDNQPDIVVVHTGNNNVAILFGQGNGSFGYLTTRPTRIHPISAAIGDFNEDGRPDVVVANFFDLYINIYIFTSIQLSRNVMTLAVGGGSRLKSFAVDDVNNDNILDIVVVNYGNKNIGILLGHGDGVFEEKTTFPLDSNSNPQSIAIGDFNKDNQLDVTVASSGSNKVDLLLGNGKGIFERQVTYGYGSTQDPSIVIASDFNHDGKSEIAVAYNNLDSIDIFVVHDTGNLTDQTTYSTGLIPDLIALADFNNDTHLDIVVTYSSDKFFGVLLGYGNGLFTDQTMYSPGFYPSSLAVGDFNNDKYIDIVVSNADGVNLGIFFGYGNGSFHNQTTFTAGYYPTAVAIGDFNNDIHLDIVFANSGSKSIGIIFGYGNGSFAKQMTYLLGYKPSCLAVGDFNSDNKIDIIVGNNDNITLGILLGYDNGSFANQIMSPVWRKDASVIAVGDLNNDDRMDIVIGGGYYYTDFAVLLGYGNGSLASPIIYSFTCWLQYITVGDLNNDDQLDIVVSSDGGNSIYTLLGIGNGSFANPTVYAAGVNPGSVIIGDFNSDNQMDVVVANTYDKSLSIFLGNSSKVIFYQMTLITGNGSRPQSFAIGDFNNDTHVDISVTNSGTHVIGIFLGYGNGSFASQMTYPAGSSPCSIAVGDFNNDTHLDVVVANCNNDNINVLLGYGNGSFAERKTYKTGVNSSSYSVAVADFDNDMFLDIIVTIYDISKIVVFVGYGNGTFTDRQEFGSGYGTHPFSVAVGDFNSDKKFDFAVANYGTDNLEIHLQTC